MTSPEHSHVHADRFVGASRGASADERKDRPSAWSLLSPKELFGVLKDAYEGWSKDRAASMGAALAYYTAFSLAPLLMVVVAVAGLVFGHEAAQAALIGQMRDLLGPSAADTVADMLTRASNLGNGVLAVAVGLATLVLAATTAFVELQDDLDRIFKAEPRVGSGIWNLIKSRLLSFAMVLFIGFLLTVSLALSAALAAIGDHLFGEMAVLLQVIGFVVSLGVISVLFALIYKVLPNVHIAWRDVLTGAIVTALLFTIGKTLIGLYIGKSSVASSFGAAGPFVIILIWIYYSTQIFLFGAEFCAKYAQRRGVSAAADAQDRGQALSSPTPATQSASKEAANDTDGTVGADEAFLVSARRRSQVPGLENSRSPREAAKAERASRKRRDDRRG